MTSMAAEAATPLRSLLIYAVDVEFFADAVRAAYPALTLHATIDRVEALRLLPTVDGLVVFAPSVDDAMLDAAPTLRWIHALTSGTETITGSSQLRPETIVTSSRGIHGPQMSELALLLMMSLARELPALLASQHDGTWARKPQPLLWNKRIAIVGAGHIGEALATRCQAMGMTVVGVSSRQGPIAGFDEMRSREPWSNAIGDADFVVVLTALDARTQHLVDATFLAAMKPAAFFINLSRGGVVDEAALVDALQRKRIAGAGLDVFEIEPLPADHALRPLPNVILTPHIGGFSDIYREQVLPMLLQNVHAMMNGDMTALVNRVA